ncbi:hypothetical protein [Psychroserpens sp. Hel_I_66]|uniref:hypothetical protein n=1 Tax=Psychroserpens sp. Hel_I_66 TaxID=1250004 RepID=UPI000648DBF1|nr:hypothetical protein [Psychroserpens sp. Hel_I_66]
MDNQNLFAQSYNQIVSNVLGGDGSKFQMLANPVDFNWPTAPTGQISPNAFAFMNMAPNYKAIGTLDFGDSTFWSNYQQTLHTLTFKVSPAQQQNLKDLQNSVISANNDVSKITTNAKSAYNTELSNNGADGMKAFYPPGGTFADYFKATHWKSDLAEANSTAQKLNTQYNQMVINLTTDPTLQNILKMMVRPTDPVSGPAPSDGAWVKVPDSSGTLQWQPSFTITGNGQQLLQQLTTGTAGGFSVTLDASKTDTNMSSAYAGGSVSAGGWFWRAKASGGWSKTDISKSDNSVKATISVKASTVIPIDPGPWYDGGFMKKLAANADGSGFGFLPPWQAKGSGSNVVFGNNGILSARVRGLVVVFGKKVVLEMDSSTYQSAASSWNASTSVSIGPFTFSANAGSSSFTEHTTGNRTTLTIEDTSTDPQIIGVNLAFPGM